MLKIHWDCTYILIKNPDWYLTLSKENILSDKNPRMCQEYCFSSCLAERVWLFKKKKTNITATSSEV